MALSQNPLFPVFKFNLSSSLTKKTSHLPLLRDVSIYSYVRPFLPPKRVKGQEYNARRISPQHFILGKSMCGLVVSRY